MTMTMSLPIAPTTLAAFAGDALRARIFTEKYALRSGEGAACEITPEDLWRRVATGIASVEAPAQQHAWAARFLWLLTDYRVVPGGRILAAVGNPNRVTALNCYVVPAPHDSIRGIYHTAYELAETCKRGGGVGVDLSSLRPKGAPVANAARTSTGAVSFMALFSLTTGVIGQDGRRGALMLTLSDSHPDVLDFCRVKRNLHQVRYANISVRLSDAFMHAVAQDAEWRLQYTNAADGIEVTRVIQARELWDELIMGATHHAEPGCLFWSTIQRCSISDAYPGMAVVSTNPCGEEPLEEYGECCLGSLNLAAFVMQPFTPQATVDVASLEQATRYTVRFLDNVLTWNEGRHPLPQQDEAARRGRRIGVGMMGLADMLCQLGLRYDSEEALAYTDQLMARIKCWAYDASADVAAERGPFPVFDAQRHFGNPFFASFPAELLDKCVSQGLRNVTLLTVPPTGTVAALAGVTSGIEPIFDLTYTRRSESLSQAEFSVMHPLVYRYRTLHPDVAVDALPDCFVTAHRINADKRVELQAAVQRHIDQALSGTINLPRGTPPETVARLYRRAWEAGAKGVTVYVEGSREGILLSAQETASGSLPSAALSLQVAPRPPVLAGVTFREETPLGTAFVTTNYVAQDPRQPFETFIRLGKAGSDAEADAEALGRLISLILRLPSPMPPLERVREIITQLEYIGGARSSGFGDARVLSVPDGVARTLKRYLETAAHGNDHASFAAELLQAPRSPGTADALALHALNGTRFCPHCHRASLVLNHGCHRCTECGYKEC
jgi:ribonucleoside-diphosphate reductase alpha chain